MLKKTILLLACVISFNIASANSFSFVESHVNTHLGNFLNSQNFDEVTRTEIKEYVSTRLSEGNRVFNISNRNEYMVAKETLLRGLLDDIESIPAANRAEPMKYYDILIRLISTYEAMEAAKASVNRGINTTVLAMRSAGTVVEKSITSLFRGFGSLT